MNSETGADDRADPGPSLLADDDAGLLIVVRQGMTLSCVGVAIGLVAALAAVSLLLMATTLVASFTCHNDNYN